MKKILRKTFQALLVLTLCVLSCIMSGCFYRSPYKKLERHIKHSGETDYYGRNCISQVLEERCRSEIVLRNDGVIEIYGCYYIDDYDVEYFYVTIYLSEYNFSPLVDGCVLFKDESYTFEGCIYIANFSEHNRVIYDCVTNVPSSTREDWISIFGDYLHLTLIFANSCLEYNNVGVSLYDLGFTYYI